MVLAYRKKTGRESFLGSHGAPTAASWKGQEPGSASTSAAGSPSRWAGRCRSSGASRGRVRASCCGSRPRRQPLEQALRAGRDVTDRRLEDRGVGLRRNAIAADLPDELERCLVNFLVARLAVGAAEDLDASTHADQYEA